ncbi:alpha/beta hydrolase [Luteimonas salinilitoris]|uniref:Alpha/beta hydrolase n=1 Tax=Luteimonas salinilitoris TaxID=3237697 RepID=A0ABV4HUX1_9GAMM
MRAALVGLALAIAASPTTAAPAPSSESAAEAASRIWLWPDRTAPGSERITSHQAIVERSADPALPDRIITGVIQPYLVVYRPPRPDGSALLVIPGGSYERVVLDREGTALVPAFVEQGGVTLFVLRYRLPGDGHEGERDAPLADAQRALRLIRTRADEWNLDPARIGVLGFSAGGHVAASLGTRFDERAYAPVDAHDDASARPDFMALVYPVIDMGEASAPIFHPVSRERLLGAAPLPEQAAAYSLQTRVGADTPPTFLLHAADDDAVPVENSLVFHRALRRAGVPAELHVYPHGGHGFGVRGASGTPLALWPEMAMAWMRAQAPSPIRHEPSSDRTP